MLDGDLPPPRIILGRQKPVQFHILTFILKNWGYLKVLSLLAVDLFTILLIFVIATQSNQMPMGKDQALRIRTKG